MLVERYKRNGSTISESEQKVLKGKKVLVAGCGGLGGYVIELLARAGVGTIGAVDPDIFDVTNLNRQLLSEEKLLGSSKAEAAYRRCAAINSDITVISRKTKIDRVNVLEILDGYDLAVDALDNIPGRLALQSGAEKKNIPLVHGAISGWYGQVSLIEPGDRLFDIIYPEGVDTIVDGTAGNPSFSPAVVAGFQAAEVLKSLLGKGERLRNKLLYFDLLENRYQIMNL
ncbi:HesA/MoeB/ThiF family protein [Spirochaeta isovalerica]|uniref:Molybdopterin/thiamine biosynthesis adenylyltransferase n=1 Tax=Spirochaeta isovalerica TaxID=150 RepID=A0A841RBK8_9SPIO|nr:HesA/MoeB/ThiF family protein [Spirochaeta isovalerica]MBB6480400.1 molybdopterin/thiamine biosynthesis adenylyltransferase [Spirochaeta isovalerica]